MKLTKIEHYYIANKATYKRVSTGIDKFTWWEFNQNQPAWEKVQSDSLIKQLESKHQEEKPK